MLSYQQTVWCRLGPAGKPGRAVADCGVQGHLVTIHRWSMATRRSPTDPVSCPRSPRRIPAGRILLIVASQVFRIMAARKVTVALMENGRDEPLLSPPRTHQGPRALAARPLTLAAEPTCRAHLDIPAGTGRRGCARPCGVSNGAGLLGAGIRGAQMTTACGTSGDGPGTPRKDHDYSDCGSVRTAWTLRSYSSRHSRALVDGMRRPRQVRRMGA
jgi:hypothetical protein